MEFETWGELTNAFLGAYGPEAQREAKENLQGGLDGQFGDEARQAYSEYVDDLDEGLQSGQLTWQDGGPPDIGDDEEELMAAAERVRNADVTDYLERVTGKLEEKLGRGLTEAELEEVLSDSVVASALDGEDVDLTDHADRLKGKVQTEAGREEVMLSAARRSAEEREEPFDPVKRAEEIADTDDPDELRRIRMEGAFQLAKMGTSYAEIDAAGEAEDGEDQSVAD